jgi:hypothetical protein
VDICGALKNILDQDLYKQSESLRYAGQEINLIPLLLLMIEESQEEQYIPNGLEAGQKEKHHYYIAFLQPVLRIIQYPHTGIHIISCSLRNTI